MNLMISEAAKRLAPAEIHLNKAVDILACATGDTVLGKVLVARSPHSDRRQPGRAGSGPCHSFSSSRARRQWRRCA